MHISLLFFAAIGASSFTLALDRSSHGNNVAKHKLLATKYEHFFPECPCSWDHTTIQNGTNFTMSRSAVLQRLCKFEPDLTLNGMLYSGGLAEQSVACCDGLYPARMGFQRTFYMRPDLQGKFGEGVLTTLTWLCTIYVLSPILSCINWIGRPCRAIVMSIVLILLTSSTVSLWITHFYNDLSGGFTVGAYILAAGAMPIGFATYRHNGNCSCWKKGAELDTEPVTVNGTPTIV